AWGRDTTIQGATPPVRGYAPCGRASPDGWCGHKARYAPRCPPGLRLRIIGAVVPVPSGAWALPLGVGPPWMPMVSPVAIVRVAPVAIGVAPVAIMRVVPVAIIRVPVVEGGIHHVRPGHHRGWRHVHGLRSDHHRHRQPHITVHLEPSRVGRARQQGKADEPHEGDHTTTWRVVASYGTIEEDRGR